VEEKRKNFIFSSAGILKELGVISLMASNTISDGENTSNASTQFLSQVLSSPVIASMATALITLIVPNAQAIAVSIGKGIPPGGARAAIEQARMWQKNFDCAKEQQIKDFQTASNTRLSVTICPSGDMLVQLSESSKRADAQWVSFESLRPKNGLNATNSNLLTYLFSSPAIAASADVTSESLQVQNNSQILAQTTVICQEDLGGGRIRRVLKYADGNCVIEEVDTFTGEVTRSSGVCQGC
jgi:hypothetical protein